MTSWPFTDPRRLIDLSIVSGISRDSEPHAVTVPLIRRRNRRALDRTTALDRTPLRKAALAHNLDHSGAAHNLARNAFACCHDPLRVGTHRVVRKLRGTDH
jgi:hypothetical protein